MTRFFHLVLLLASLTLAAGTSDTVAIKGHIQVWQNQLNWKTSNRILVTHTGFLRDSSSTLVSSDSCSNPITVENANFLSPTMNFGYRYEATATSINDVATLGFWSRYSGTGFDTTWVPDGHQLLWNKVHVEDRMTIDSLWSSFSTPPIAQAYARWVYIPDGNQVKVCATRTNIGVSDTIVIQNNWLRSH